ncbi:helix-turn-helix domain-containing protein [Pedobacter soli]
MLLGQKIRVQRLTKKYSQQFMADKLGISQFAYSKIERGKTDITVRRMIDIANILEIPAAKLLP